MLLRRISEKLAAAVAIVTAIQATGPGRELGPQRALVQFANMIAISTNRNPADFINYGNWCGFSGSGEPVDEIDSFVERCCLHHDNCYDELNANECRMYFNIAPYVAKYHWEIQNGTVVCDKDSNRACAYGVCECDRAAAVCIGKHPFNPNNKRIEDSSRQK